jgi:hypothetical protein
VLEGRVKGIVRAVARGTDEDGHQWLILQPFGEPVPTKPVADVIRYIIQIAEVIGELAAVGWSQGNISYSNVQTFPDGNAGLIDFGAARQVNEASHKNWKALFGIAFLRSWPAMSLPRTLNATCPSSGNLRSQN